MIAPSLRSSSASWFDPELHGAVAAMGGSLEQALSLAQSLSDRAALLGEDTSGYLATLATVGAADLTTARVLEPHLDALTILRQAGDPDLSDLGVNADSTWGVFAAQAPGLGLLAERAPSGAGSAGGPAGVRVHGTKPWCSLADRLSHALVTARDEEGRDGLFAIPLNHRGIRADAGDWVSRGLRDVTTATLSCVEVPAVPIGGPDWYLSRPGFSWGAIAVAAVWYGAAVAIVERLRRSATRRPPDQYALLCLGEAHLAVRGARLSLEEAATRIDRGEAEGGAGQVLAEETRGTVAAACERALTLSGHASGPAPLTHDEEHARRVCDLTVYLRQHHAGRDLARLGELLLQDHA